MTSSFPENGRSTDGRQRECGFATENVEAFALGALDRRDRNRMERHLVWCGRCRRAVAEAHSVTDLLPLLAAPATPSASVKSALLDRVAREPQEAPWPQPNPWVATAPSTPEPEPAHGGWRRWLPSVVIAPLAIALIILAAWSNSLRNEVDYLRAEQQGGIELTSGNGMQLYAMNPTCPTCSEVASGHFGGDPEGRVGVVVAWNLDPNEQHQVWCVDKNGEKWMVTDLEVEPTGDVVQTISFPQPLGGYQQIYVARHDGTADPEAELMVAMDGEQTEETPAADPSNVWGD